MQIACVNVPRFAVEAERQRSFDPSTLRLRSGQAPLRTGSAQDIAARLILIGETKVLDCSLGAEASGVRPGMRMSEAIGLCRRPDGRASARAVVLPPDVPYYRRRFEEVLDVLERFSPEVEAGDTGTAYLSLRGLAGEPGAFGEGLIAALHGRTGFMAAVGAAGGKFAARVAATTTRPGLAKTVAAGEEAAFLAPLSIEHLPLSDSARWRLRLLGLKTMGDIAALPLGAFQAQFGPEGKRCWELARGIDGEPLLPRVKEETVVRRLQLPAAAVTLEAILAGVERLVQAAYADAGRRPDGRPGRAVWPSGRWVRKAVVRGTLDGGGAWELAVPFREALSEARDAWFVIKSAIMRRPPERPVEELEVELVGLSAESGKQAGMLEGKGRLWGQVEEALRQLQTQQGEAAIGKVVEVEPWSRIPERRAALVDFER